MSARIHTGVLVAEVAVLLAACDTSEDEPEDAPPDVEFENLDGDLRSGSASGASRSCCTAGRRGARRAFRRRPYIEVVHQDVGDKVELPGMNTEDELSE